MPTATQLLAVTHDTAPTDTRVLPLGTGGAAVGLSEVPFQVKAYGS
jgi:hypothetical protein